MPASLATLGAALWRFPSSRRLHFQRLCRKLQTEREGEFQTAAARGEGGRPEPRGARRAAAAAGEPARGQLAKCDGWIRNGAEQIETEVDELAAAAVGASTNSRGLGTVDEAD